MNRRVFLAMAMVALPLALGACASGGSGSSSGRNPNLLTLEDLEPYRAQDVYQTIRRLRSNWLAGRGSQGSWTPGTGGALPTRGNDGGSSQVQVYIDGIKSQTGIEALKELSVEIVREIQYMDSRDATMMYGTDHGNGAIQVFTR